MTEQYLQLLEEKEKVHGSNVLGKVAPKILSRETSNYINALKAPKKPMYVEQFHDSRETPSVDTYLQAFEDEEMPIKDNEVQDPEHKELTDTNIQLEIKQIKTQLEAVNKRYGASGSGGGGGSVAKQLAYGGTIDGDLEIKGDLTIGGQLSADILIPKLSVVNISESYTIKETDDVVFAKLTQSSNVLLYSAANNIGVHKVIKNHPQSSNNLTLSSISLIDTVQSIVLSPGEAVEVISDDTSWLII